MEDVTRIDDEGNYDSEDDFDDAGDKDVLIRKPKITGKILGVKK